MSFLKAWIEKRELDLKKKIIELEYAERNIELRFKEIEMRCSLKESDAQVNGNKERNEYECTWHSEMEKKKIELARLDALIEARKETIENDEKCYKEVLRDNSETIKCLRSTIETMSKNMKTSDTKIEVIK